MADRSIFKSFSSKGKPQYVIAKGNVVVDNGVITSELPKGELLRRKPQQAANLYYTKSSNDDISANNCGRV